MTHAGAQPTTATPVDAVRAALDDPELRNELIRHALSRLGKLLADRPAAVRADIAGDAVQEASKRAWERRAEFDASRSVAAWLHGILELVMYEHCRTLHKQPAQPDANPAAWDAMAEHFASDSVELNELLNALSADQRRIVTMHHLDGLGHEQIAAELGISVGNSRVRVARAMIALRELAAKEGGR
jgi:RNA polymerase sigma-70 factor, ECF subfamily